MVLGTIALSQILYHKTFAVKQGLSPDKKRTLAKDWKELVKPPDKVPGCGAKMQNAIKKADGRQLAYKKQEYSLFFKLPAEIRNQIYEQLLVAEEPIIPDRQLVGSRMRDYKRMGNVYRPPKGLDASILRACRAICYEGSPILYSQNLFRFRRTYDITWFHNDDLEYGRGMFTASVHLISKSYVEFFGIYHLY